MQTSYLNSWTDTIKYSVLNKVSVPKEKIKIKLNKHLKYYQAILILSFQTIYGEPELSEFQAFSSLLREVRNRFVN